MTGLITSVRGWCAGRGLPLAMTLAALVAAGAAAAGIDVRSSYGAQVTGDEPQYLLTAISVAEDRSLNISDELAQRRYAPFHEVALPEQTKALLGGGRISPHDPLLPALLAAPMAAGGWVGAKAALACLAGLLAALLVWTAVRRFAVPLRTSTIAVLLLASSAPLAVYGSQVYPELPAALLVLAAVAALAGPITGRSLGLALAAIALLPWLAAKYVPLVAALAGCALWLTAGSRRRTLAFTAGLGVAAGTFLVLHQLWYGGWTAYATGDHFIGGEFTAVGSSPDLLGRSRRIAGLMVDDTFGLAAWQPAYLLAVPALGALLVARPRRVGLLALPIAVGWLTATFVALTMQGWWFPGRQIIVLLPLCALLLAWWVGRSQPRLLLLLCTGLLGVASYALLLIDGHNGRLTWVVDFDQTGNPWYALWRNALPDYLDVDTGTWVRHAAWSVALLGLLLTGAWCAHLSKTVQKTDTDAASGSTRTRESSGTDSFDGRCEETIVPSTSSTR